MAQEKTKRNWLSTTAAPALPTTAELAGGFKHKQQDVFWFIKHLLAELSVEESEAGETVRASIWRQSSTGSLVTGTRRRSRPVFWSGQQRRKSVS